MLKKVLQYIDENLEKYIIVSSYLAMAGIICVEVVRRFAFNQQAPWSTTVPILLFLWLTWFGASYNIKIRGHLTLAEVRKKLPYNAQFACFVLDAILWMVFAGIVIYFSYFQVHLSYDNFAIVEGTDDVMQWWFYLAIPLAWILMVVRVLQVLAKDIKTYISKQPFTFESSIEKLE